MQSERTSFFDDDELNIVFDFRKIDKKDSKDLALPPTIKDSLTRTTSEAKVGINATFALQGKLLAMYKGSTKTPDFVLNLAHSRLKPVSGTGTFPPHGFQVAKNGASFDFYSSDKGTIDRWISALKSICVLLNFHDEFKALKMIGRGSFAKVYLVESKTDGKSYAVKAFTKESVIASNKSNAKPSMLNEIEIMRSLDHENIIKLYEVYETDKSIYLVLELIQGKSLQDILKKPSFRDEHSEVKVINMIRSILDALAYLAAKGIMHRDLKPDNILVDKGDKIKIVDFGLATEIDLPIYIFKKCGTPGYIAPEVFKYDEKDARTFYNHKCDVFSAGCILFFMLFGYPFFDAPNASEILKQNRKFGPDFDAIILLKEEAKKPNSKINKDGLNLLLGLCEFEQSKRLTAQAALSHAYFIPTPNQMQKITNDGLDPKTGLPYIPPKEQILDKLKGSSSGSATSTHKADRFAEKDSLYLDMGKPELNGKMDTLTSQSQNNSLLLHGHGSNANVGSNSGSRSGFAKAGLQDMKNSGMSSSFKNKGSGGNNLLKAAIFNSGAKNRDDGDSSPKINPDAVKGDRRGSANLPSKQTSFGEKRSGSLSPEPQYPDAEDDIPVESSQNQKISDKMTSNPSHPSKMLTQNRRFNPFEKK